ncbi:MAG TPA: MBL fold metallo-hydrolase [Anaerolineales bacterium]|nr:MBL fold metallo-hydrolase [Anaerolineales bacterium]
MCLLASCNSTSLTPVGPARTPDNINGKPCSEEITAIQVLGSGGPLPNHPRASTGYLVWMGGKSKLLLDVGGGTFVRFGEAGGRVEELDLVLLSHFHADHVSDLPAFLWAARVSGRVYRNLTVVGPTGNMDFPDIHTFLQTLLDGDNGAFRQLSVIPIEVVSADAGGTRITTVYKDNNIEILALGVPHANSPTLAFKLILGETSVVFGADQNGRNPDFLQFIQNVDLLVLHFAIDENPGRAMVGEGSALEYHAPPSLVGQMAAAGDPGTLLLSHLNLRDPRSADLESNLEIVRSEYSGPVILAEDLLCIPLGNELLTPQQ